MSIRKMAERITIERENYQEAERLMMAMMQKNPTFQQGMWSFRVPMPEVPPENWN